MKVGDLVKYKDSVMPITSPIRGKVYVITRIYPSGVGALLGGFPDNEAHRMDHLEVVSASR